MKVVYRMLIETKIDEDESNLPSAFGQLLSSLLLHLVHGGRFLEMTPILQVLHYFDKSF